MYSKRRISFAVATAFSLAIIGAPVVLSAKPRCEPGAVKTPVGYYLDHWCYKGLNTYQAGNHNRPSQAQFPRAVKFKQVQRRNLQVVAPR
jgi:hypothetical protein